MPPKAHPGSDDSSESESLGLSEESELDWESDDDGSDWESSDDDWRSCARSDSSSDGSDWESDSTDHDHDHEARQDENADEGLAILIEMYMQSEVTAMRFCQLCHFFSLGGLKGAASKYGMKPNLPEHRYQRKLDGVLGFKQQDAKLMHITVPGQGKHDLHCTERTLPVLPPHESILEEVSENPSLQENLGLYAGGEDWDLTSYRGHVVTQQPGPPVFPIVLYFDGVPYSKTDSILGIWVYNEVSGRRHMAVILRKRNFCKCGCKGWCTLWPVWRMLHWSFAALARGRHPTERPDGTGWQAGRDDRRAAVSDEIMSCRGAVVKMKGDLLEFAVTLGFPATGSRGRPCISCNWHPDLGYTAPLASFDPYTFPFVVTTAESYDAACRRAEIHVHTSQEDRDDISPLLIYDKRTTTTSSMGRCLREDLPRLGLRKGDRLEPSASCPWVAAFEQLVGMVSVTFWRISNESIAKHRNPLFDESIGISMLLIFFDVMHTLNLGVMLIIARSILWALIDANAWNVEGTAEVRQQVSALQYRRELFNFYSAYRRANPTAPITEVADFTTKMLGTNQKRDLKVKAAECWGIVLGLPSLIDKHRAALGPVAGPFLRATNSIIEHVQIMKRSPRVMSPDAVQGLFDTCQECIHSLDEVPGFRFTPKFHIWLHIVFDAMTRGNPWHAATWLDESFNHKLKRAAAGVHAAVFERKLFRRITVLMGIAYERITQALARR